MTATDKELQGHLHNWLDIPHITHAQKRDNALVLDVYVCSYRQGQSLSGQILDVPLLAFWRPKVELRSRLSWAQSKKVVSTYTVQKKMPWGQYWNKLFSLRYFLFGRNIANSKDMEALLGTAVLDLLGQVRRSV